MNEPLMSVEQVAEYLNVPMKTVYRWNTAHTGPPGARVGRYVRYRRADVDAWLEEHVSNPVIDLKVEGDAAWPDLRKSGVVYCGTRIGMAALGGGMRSGAPSIAVRLDLPDGKPAVAETSLRELETAVRALVARYGSQIAL